MNENKEEIDNLLQKTYKKAIETLFPPEELNGVLIKAISLLQVKDMKNLINSPEILKPKNQISEEQKPFKQKPKRQIFEKKELFFSRIEKSGSSFLKGKENLSMFLARNIEEFELEMPNKKNYEDFA